MCRHFRSGRNYPKGAVTKVFQTRHGKDGNCWPACLASILEMSISRLEHCSGHLPDWKEQTDRFLADSGYFFIELTKYHGDQVFRNITAPPNGTHVIAGCTSRRGFSHAVIARVEHTKLEEGECTEFHLRIVHDPADETLEDAEHYAINSIIFLCRLDAVVLTETSHEND